MKGFPKHINSRQDVVNLLVSHPAEMRAELQAMLSEVLVWQQGLALAADDPGLTDATHQVKTITEDDQEVRYQYELREDPNCKLYRLGITQADVANMIGE